MPRSRNPSGVRPCLPHVSRADDEAPVMKTMMVDVMMTVAQIAVVDVNVNAAVGRKRTGW
jgi:hypothetical protein